MALSGIDGSGKGHVTARLVRALEERGVRAVGLNIDGWLNLPEKRFSDVRLKRFYRPYYDLSFWVECSFETVLKRAIARAQEGLPPEETVSAYRRIYFPAQEIHLVLDDPRAAATAILDNDPRLGPRPRS